MPGKYQKHCPYTGHIWLVLVPRLKENGKHEMSELTATSRRNRPFPDLLSTRHWPTRSLPHLTGLVLGAACLMFSLKERGGKLRRTEWLFQGRCNIFPGGLKDLTRPDVWLYQIRISTVGDRHLAATSLTCIHEAEDRRQRLSFQPKAFLL